VAVQLLRYRVGVNSLVSRHTVGYPYFPWYFVMLCIGKYYHLVEEVRVESQRKIPLTNQQDVIEIYCLL